MSNETHELRSSPPRELKLDTAVLLNNGYVGIVKYMHGSTIGIELSQEHPNGDDGRKTFPCSPGCALFLLTRDIITIIDVSDTNETRCKFHFTSPNTQETIYFPTASALKQIVSSQQELLTIGYTRHLQQSLLDRHIPSDIIQLCVLYNSHQFRIGDKVELSTGTAGVIWCIGVNHLNRIHFAIKPVETNKREPIFYSFDDIHEIFDRNIDFELTLGLHVTLEGDRDAQIKYMGAYGDAIDDVIGVAVHDADLSGCHDGKGYFDCKPHKNGLFVTRAQIVSLARQELLQQIPVFVRNCYSDDVALQLESTRKIRKTLSIPYNPPIDEVIESGVLTQLIKFLKNDECPKLQLEAAWSITNIASGTQEHTMTVVRYGALPIFVELLKSQHRELQNQSVWALGNICGDGIESRDMVIKLDALTHLLPLCDIQPTTQKAKSMLQNVAWTLSNFVRGKPSPDWNVVKSALNGLKVMIKQKDVEILTDVCWALSYLSDSEDDNQLEGIMQSGILCEVVDLLSHSSAHVQQPSLRVFGNLLQRDGIDSKAILALGILPHFKHILSTNKSHSRRLKKDCCWAISNILTGDADDVEQVIQADLVPLLMDVVKSERFELFKEAIWCLSNATNSATDAQIAYFVRQGMLECFCAVLRSLMTRHVRAVMVILIGIENTLKSGEKLFAKQQPNVYTQAMRNCKGVELLEMLVSSDSVQNALRDVAQRILKTYFSENQTEDKVDRAVEEAAVKKSSVVPKKYTCFKCKAVGKHWIMDCDQHTQ